MNIEKLQKWALFAEILGGAAIVITLALLVFELQRNTVAIDRATHSEITQSIIEWRRDFALNAEVRETMRRVRASQELSPDQLAILGGLGRNLYTNLERAFWASEYGQIGDSEWARFESSICNNVPILWDDSVPQYYTREFVEYVRACAEFANYGGR